MELNLIHAGLDNWGFSLESYMGDVYLPYRTLAIGFAIVIALIIKKKRKKTF